MTRISGLPRPSRSFAPALLSVPLLLTACGAGVVTYRDVDKVVGTTDAYGAPHNTVYGANAETEREFIRITVYERSECDKLRMKVVHRVSETVKDGKVVSREPPKTIQVAEGTFGTVPCNERWARNVWVALRIGGQTYRLGMPSPLGEVRANLASELKQSLYAEPAPAEAVVVVNGVDAGTVSLAPYTSHEARVNALLDEFRVILGKPEGMVTTDDITRSYELYEQLGQLDTGGDARVTGLRMRFLELLYQRKQHEATENLRRNIKALNEAKNLMPAIGAGLLPGYVVSAVNAGLASPEALWWARGEAALALRHYPALCNPAPFGWNRIGGDLPAVSRFAFSYLRFAYDDPFQTEVRALCGRAGGWR